MSCFVARKQDGIGKFAIQCLITALTSTNYLQIINMVIDL